MNKLVPAALISLLLASAGSAHAATCESLSSLKLQDATITMAQTVAAGAFTPPGRGGRAGAPISDLPAFCRVAATLTPTKESDIKIEVWLPLDSARGGPASGWNGKFQATGNGGWNGNIDTNALAAGVRRGYATASTDTGHEGGGGPWMASREKLIDYGHRAVHEMTVKAKAIVNAFYESQPRFSYFVGCSAGGRQGLMAAQRYPDDFDGIVAGAPVLSPTARATFAVAVAQQLRKTADSYIPQSKYAAINNAVLDACDAVDGATDRLIENPKACKFDPAVLTCKAGDSDSCLTPAQVEAARAIYAPLVNPQTKEVISAPLALSSELGWQTYGGQQPFGIATQMFQFMVFNDPKWDYTTLNFSSHMDLVKKAEAGAMNALDPNLKPFYASNGRLIQYHGWSDPQVSANTSTDYYDRVIKTVGGVSTVKNNHRLFMVPGMAHCGGGTGTSTFDMLTALEQWVEQGRAPDTIPASRVVQGKTDRTRPLCAYPQQASYKGSGDINDAANFVCK
jgi:feruloyl esterase